MSQHLRIQIWILSAMVSFGLPLIGLSLPCFGQLATFQVSDIDDVSPNDTGFFDVYFDLTSGPVDVVGWDFALSIDNAAASGISFTSAELTPGGLAFANGAPAITVNTDSVSANDFDGLLTSITVPDGRTDLVRINYAVDGGASFPSIANLEFGADGANNITDSGLSPLADSEINAAINVVPEPSAMSLAVLGSLLLVVLPRRIL